MSQQQPAHDQQRFFFVHVEKDLRAGLYIDRGGIEANRLFPKNTVILFVDPSYFCIIIVLNFYWDLQSPQEKLKTMLMQNFGATAKSIMVFLKNAHT